MLDFTLRCILLEPSYGEEMKTVKHIAVLLIGWLFIVLGIAGLFLPFLQGILFLIIGLAILSTRSELIRRLLSRVEERYPHHYEHIQAWRTKMTGWFRKG